MSNSIKTIEGNLAAPSAQYVLLASRFNNLIVESLIKGAMDALYRHGVSEKDIQLVRVPGAFEMPLAAKKLAACRRFDAIIALGAVIRGGTPHFEYVAGECAKGLAQVSLETGIPIGFGVLTCDNIEQAVARAGTKAGNKGAEAALSALEMVSLLPQIEN